MGKQLRDSNSLFIGFKGLGSGDGRNSYANRNVNYDSLGLRVRPPIQTHFTIVLLADRATQKGDPVLREAPVSRQLLGWYVRV